MKPFRHYSGRFVTTTARTGVLAPEFPITLKIGWIQDVNMTNMHQNIFSWVFQVSLVVSIILEQIDI
jgi:hypothetical protein